MNNFLKKKVLPLISHLSAVQEEKEREQLGGKSHGRRS